MFSIMLSHKKSVRVPSETLKRIEKLEEVESLPKNGNMNLTPCW